MRGGAVAAPPMTLFPVGLMLLTTPEPYITVPQVLAFLGKTKVQDDELLATMVGAACEMIRERVGEVAPVACRTTVPAQQWQHTGTLVLEHRPVVEVVEVRDRSGPVAGAELTSREGIVALPGGTFGDVTVEYVAGRDPIPANFALAAIELAAHLWRNSQNAGQARPAPGQPDATVLPGTSYSMPYRVRELLGLGKHQTDVPLVY